MEVKLNEVLLAHVLPYEDPSAGRRHFASGIGSRDRLIPVEEGVIRWERDFYSNYPGAYPVSELTMDLELDFTESYLMMPSVTYNGNPFGGGKDPLGFDYKGEPTSYASGRVAVPACSFAENAEVSVGLFADPRVLPEGCGVSGSIVKKEGEKTILRLLVPEQEMPVIFARMGTYIPGYRNTVLVSHDKPLTAVAYIVYGKREAGLPGYSRLLDFAWKTFRHAVHPWYGEKTLYDLALTYAKESLLEETEVGTYFNIGLSWDGKQFNKRSLTDASSFEAGWCGQNIGYANAFLYDYLLTGKEESRDLGLLVLDSWMKTTLPSGLMYVRFRPVYLSDPEAAKTAVIDACNLGSAVENLLEAYELAERCGTPRPAYKEAALAICEAVLKTQLENGAYPCAYDPEGKVLQAEGNTGDFMMAGMLFAYAATKDERYLTSASCAFDCYFGALRDKGFTTAGALDSFCVDKESAMPILSSALMLYKISGKAEYLKAAEHTAYYLSTWQWHHTVSFPEGTAMGDMGFDTFGGTAVSTEHNHIDAYALRYCSYLLVLGEYTGDPLWKERAVAIWNNATEGVSDGTYGESGLIYPAGGQSEAFCYARWGQAFQTSRWLVAWMGAFRLEVLRKTDFFRRAGMDDPIRV